MSNETEAIEEDAEEDLSEFAIYTDGKGYHILAERVEYDPDKKYLIGFVGEREVAAFLNVIGYEETLSYDE